MQAKICCLFQPWSDYRIAPDIIKIPFIYLQKLNINQITTVFAFIYNLFLSQQNKSIVINCPELYFLFHVNFHYLKTHRFATFIL